MAQKKIPIRALKFNSSIEFKTNESVREFSGVAYSGEMIPNHWFWGNLVFDSQAISAKERIPILLNHDPSKIVGHGSVEGGSYISVSGSVISETDAGREVTLLSDKGFPWQMSVHIEPSFVEKIAKGKNTFVNGKEFQGPITVFRNSQIREVSFTPIGADSNTSATIFHDEKDFISLEEKDMSEETKQTEEALEAKPLEEPAAKPEEKKEPKAEEPAAEELQMSADGMREKLIALDGEDLKAAYIFACCGGCAQGKSCDDDHKAKKKKIELSEDDFNALNEKISKLTQELNSYKDAEKKKKEKMKLERLAQFKLDAEKQSLFMQMSDEHFDAALSLVSKKEVSPLLFTEVAKGDGVVVADSADPESIRKAATELVNKFSKEGKKLDFIDAVKMAREI